MTTMDGNDLRFDFAALPERVWEAMTNPTKAAEWLPDGLVAEVGRRFSLPGPDRISGEVIAVDPPTRVVLRWHRPTDMAAPPVDSVMTWIVERAAGGASVRVITSSNDDPGVADLVVAVRTLFDDRLRRVLRPAHGPASAPPLLVDLATPAGAASPAVGVGAGAAPVEGRSQAVSVWPVLRKLKRRAREPGPRRRTGTALAYRLMAVIAIAAVVAAITFGASAIPWANAPEESTPGDAIVGPVSPAALDTAVPANLGGKSPGSAGTAPGSAGTPTSGSTGIPATIPTVTVPATIPTVTVPQVIPPLTVSLHVVDQLLGYTVNVTITNPAGSPQAWHNLTVHIEGLNLLIDVVGSVVKLLLPGNDPCFAPSVATIVGGGQTLEFSFTVTGALGEPTQARLNQGAC